MRGILNQKLGFEEMAQRAGPGGQKLTYMEGWKVVEFANDVFGFNGWSSSILHLSRDYVSSFSFFGSAYFH
jgi:DNA repair and recombination protein RAD52